MKKILLIIGTIVVLAIGAFGVWVYGVYQNGVRQYEIAGETVGLAGLSFSRSSNAPNTLSATFTERLMPFTVENFPFDEACTVLANDGDATYDVITIIATGEGTQAIQAYNVANRVCTQVAN